MSKKKRKTRSQKETVKKHQFSHVLPATKTETIQTEDIESDSKRVRVVKNDKIPSHILGDFKKVSSIVGIMMALVLITWLLLTYTDIFSGILGKYQISY